MHTQKLKQIIKDTGLGNFKCLLNIFQAVRIHVTRWLEPDIIIDILLSTFWPQQANLGKERTFTNKRHDMANIKRCHVSLQHGTSGEHMTAND